MTQELFKDFDPVSPAAWKQKIQADLKGADYNETLLWKTEEGIVVKPFYTQEDRANLSVNVSSEGFKICQSIFIDNEKIANKLSKDALKRGANAIQFVANKTFDCKAVLEGLQADCYYFKLQFLDQQLIHNIQQELASKTVYFQVDPIGQIAATGNWFSSLKNDFETLTSINKKSKNSLFVNASLYQNAGANIAQELAYALAHANEYLNYFDKSAEENIHFSFSVGSYYFFEIAKLRAFRILFNTLAEEYNFENKQIHIFTTPSLRNKTLYDYNVNMLRTTSECMSAILGGSDAVCNVRYDAIYHKSNEFGERIARNQLLILREESYFKNAQEIANGAYYIDSLTNQLAEKALTIFKQIEKGGGFLKQLKEGVIQKKISESAKREQEKFNNQEIVLLGSNKLHNPEDRMKNDIEIHPFLKQNKIKTLITPILQKRLSEAYETKRLEQE